MTDLAKARVLIQDQNPDDQIFTDAEISLILQEESKKRTVEATKVTFDGCYFAIDEVLSRETQTIKVLNEFGDPLPGSVDMDASFVTFSEDPGSRVFVEALFIDWKSVQGRLLEIIATDIRKWNSYSAGGLSEQFSKQDLLNYAKSLLPAKGMW